MSQTRATRVSNTHNNDWMRELESDAMKFQAVVSRLDYIAGCASHANALGDRQATGIRLEEIREGLRLLCELAGVKLGA